MKGASSICIMLAAVIPFGFGGSEARAARRAAALPEFAYRDVTVNFVDADGKPIADASLYGFCPELDLIWPPKNLEVRGKTDPLGSVKVGIPPGKWQFFAVGSTRSGQLVAAWTGPRDYSAGDTERLAPAITKRWSFQYDRGEKLAPSRLLIKPQGFPLWLAGHFDASGSAAPVQVSAGPAEMWIEGDATASAPGFALAGGTIGDQTPGSGERIVIRGKPAMVECRGGNGQAVLSWIRSDSFGLEGQVALRATAPAGASKVLLTPGDYTLSYRRPMGELTASFVGQLYKMPAGRFVRLNLTSPLAAGIDQELYEDEESQHRMLVGKLYLSDANGHVLGVLLDAQRKPVRFDAKVSFAGQSFAAIPGSRAAAAEAAGAPNARRRPARTDEKEDIDEEDEEDPHAFRPRFDQTLFRAEVGSAVGGAFREAVWHITGPPGVSARLQFNLSNDQRAPVAGRSFRMQVPKVIARHAANVLEQADQLSLTMENASFRKRKVSPTSVNLIPSSEHGSADHAGRHINIGPRLFYYDQPMLAHTFPHEFGHNHGFYHGGLLECVVEIARSAGGPHLTRQEIKWQFFDRMNGRRAGEKWPYEPLYLYCYSQGGAKFVQFMSNSEPLVLAALDKQYTKDELTAAMLSLALGRDLTSICQKYGLQVTADSVQRAVRDAATVCVK